MKVRHVVNAAAAVATSPTEEIQEYEFPLDLQWRKFNIGILFLYLIKLEISVLKSVEQRGNKVEPLK